jgi:hypothetical protein
MSKNGRSTLSSVALTLAVAGVILAVSSSGLIFSFMMDSMVTDIDEADLVPSGEGVHGSEYSATTRAQIMGAMQLSVTDDDGDGWAWISITIDGDKVQRSKNVSFPFIEQYPIEGKGEIVIIVVPRPGTPISDLEVDLSVSGTYGLVGAVTGMALAGPCCVAWLGSLTACLIGIYLTVVERKRPEG